MISKTAYSEQTDIKHNIFDSLSQLGFFSNFCAWPMQSTTYEQSARCQSALIFHLICRNQDLNKISCLVFH